MGCHALLQGIFPTREGTHISCSSCIASEFFTAGPPRKPAYQSTWMENWSFPYFHAISLFLHLKMSQRTDPATSGEHGIGENFLFTKGLKNIWTETSQYLYTQ